MTNLSFPGFKVLLMGPSGTGKTFSIHTLIESGLDVFYLDIDRSLETIIGYYADKGKPIPPNFHWHYLAPSSTGFKSLITMSEAVGKFDMSTLAKMKDNDRGQNNRLSALLEVFNNFTDQRDGKSYGAVDSWDNSRVLVLDSLTALNKIIFQVVVGNRVLRDKPDYGMAQNLFSALYERLTTGCICSFVMIAHVERQVDEVLGGIKLMPVTIGQALKAELPIPFSDVILSSRNATEWVWDTANGQADLKTRNLPYSSKLPQDFGPIVKTWMKRRDV